MRLVMILLLGGLVLAALAGCSDKQKEAARLEEEMKEMEGGDTVAGPEAAETVDTTMPEMPTADASAVPDETEPEAPPMPPVPRGMGYTVQVASCEDEDYARHLVDVYTERGYDPYVTTITFEGQTYHRVRIGSFDGFSGAKALQNELNDRFSLNSWIDRLDQ